MAAQTISTVTSNNPLIHGQGTKTYEITPYKWMIAWIVFIALLAVLAQTQTGYTAIYYGLFLILVVLLVSQYKAIATVLLPVGFQVPEGVTPSS